jgi:hypothetical protein
MLVEEVSFVQIDREPGFHAEATQMADPSQFVQPRADGWRIPWLTAS